MELTRERLISAALEAFSINSYDGVSARHIERLAGVERGLVAYHFGTKQALWDETVNSIFEPLLDELLALKSALRDVSPRERTRAMVMTYTRFNASHPEFFRMLILEGLLTTQRTVHLRHHLLRATSLFRDIVGASRPSTDEDVIVMYLILGAAGTPFAMPAYSAPDTGPSLHENVSIGDPSFIDKYAAAVASMALSFATPHTDPPRSATPPGATDS